MQRCATITTLLALGLAMASTAQAGELSSVARERALERAEGPVSTIAASATTVGAVRTALEGTQPPVLAGMPDAMASSAMQQQIADEPVEAVTMTGAFTLTSAKVPRGLPFPKGRYLTVGVDVATHHAVYVQLGNKRPKLPGVTLTVKRTATIARRHRKQAHAASGWNCINPHCYAIAERPMYGNEMVVATQANHLTETMSVEPAGFIDEEEWATFDDRYWIEVGQEAGDGYDCCSVRWFFAWNRKGVGYQQYIHPPGDRWLGGNYDYHLHYTGPGAWGAEVGNVLVGSATGLRTYSTWLQVGLEAMSWDAPFNVSRHETNEWWTNWTLHEWARERWTASPHLCMWRNPYSGWKGNVRTQTC